MNPKITGKHWLIAAIVAVVVLIGWRVAEARKAAAKIYNSEFVIHAEMPTADEAVQWAFMEANAQYYAFEPVATNVTFAPIEKAFRGQYDSDRERANSRTFGSAYDSSDSFKRAETNWTCDLTITHAKPKPPHKI
ncbi:MAG TPA: hypothetical protein P5038_00445 [Candidatus Paceibacterota bacterium]|nr:hypothetical protein [Candidatus Paceibacterota bacterium]HRT55072.1 hypothetical protein [Candidatus Paceibacterota bacterium]